MAPGRSGQSFKHRLRRGHPMRPVMTRQLARLDRADPDEIRRFQERRLRMLIRISARFSPFYRDWFSEQRVDPRDIRSLDDLAVLPLLTKRDLIDSPEQFCVYPRAGMWAARSSGTSGQPVTAYRTPGSSVYELAVLERQWGWFGVPRGARRVILRGSDFAAAGGPPVKLVPGANHLLVSSFALTGDNVDQIDEAIRAFEPHAIEGWPSSIAVLASMFRDRGLRCPLGAIITSSEVMSPGQRALMREVFEGPVVDHYGQTERVAMAGGCEAGGYHVFDDYAIVELLPVDGRSDRREIVGTSLHNWGFPLFRYRTGDEVVDVSTKGPCPCGRHFRLLGEIDGRIEDSFTAADGRTLPLPATVVDDLTGLREAQIVQLAPGNFEVRVVPGKDYDGAATAEQVRRNVDWLFGRGQQVTLRVVSSLSGSSGGKVKSSYVASSSEVEGR
ncbi:MULTISPECIES: phenylacetate--CoA ligase family protein [Gordonia]|uniref:Phenylacetate--CoA ligase family protein n=1 Tax=Gordonia tangerina TaxID=2911060 RepID=A0ABS9DLN6_9ACTN|nr:phenylacetate--CoA ligase family protein [Gordonia tangerina]MCF3940148.1 phenylacetate--CoA ligase family protein [Gordonia tangerina]